MVDKPHEDLVEIQEINKDPSLTNIVRKAFRISVSLQENFFIVISQKKYPLYDISNLGVGVSIRSDKVFQVGRILANCDVAYGDELFKGIEGKIIHCSPDGNESLLYGIQWLNLDRTTVDKMKQVVLLLKKELFENENFDIDIDSEL